MSKPANPRVLVIGYGNTLRGDDGVGPRLAEAVAGLKLEGVATLTCDLLTPELADNISRAEQVVFVDATVAETVEAQLRPLAPADSSQLMAHAADPRTMLALARDVFGHAPQAWLLTIPVAQMAIGENLSAIAQINFEQGLKLLKTFLEQNASG